jgi:Zn-dependent protease
MPIATMLDASIQINMVLAIFNLIPFPPLDGSRMVSSLLNYNAQRKYESIERFSFLFFLLLWFTNALAYLMLPARVASQEVKELFLKMLI